MDRTLFGTKECDFLLVYLKKTSGFFPLYQYAELTHHLFKKTYRCCAPKPLLAAALLFSPFDVHTVYTNLGDQCPNPKSSYES
jgi:hypothetical protein